MPEIIGVKFKNTSKAYYFSPEGIKFKAEENVIVETSRGVEFGKVVIANKDISDDEIKTQLKPIIRKATIEDQEQFDRNLMDGEKALKVAVEKLKKYKLDLKFSDVEYTFDRKKIIFCFTAPSRIDFREFVRDLGATFKTRIELRQIHEREDFKMKGALAPCGRMCCCASYLNDFEKVSIKMAKNQGLSLNPQKISGLCGKLMCCLKYENENYKEAAQLMPKEGTFVKTAEGEGKVESNDLLRYRCLVKFIREDGITRKYFDLEEIEFEKSADKKKNIQSKNNKNQNDKVNNKKVNNKKVDDKKVNQKNSNKDLKSNKDNTSKENPNKNNQNKNHQTNKNNQNKNLQNNKNSQNNKNQQNKNQNNKNQQNKQNNKNQQNKNNIKNKKFKNKKVNNNNNNNNNNDKNKNINE